MSKLPFIEKGCAKLLNIQEIVDMIHPSSELGKRAKQSAKPFTPGQEEALQDEYDKIFTLMNSIKKESDFFDSVSSPLSKMESIRHPLTKALNSETLELQEIYEIKNFLFYYQQVRNELIKRNLTQTIPLPDVTLLFSYLDSEGQNVPIFHLSSRYSEKLHSLKSEYHQLKNRLTYLEQEGLEEAKKETGLKELSRQIVVSRQNIKLLSIIEKSKWFAVSAENFANITFILKKSDKALELESEIHSLSKKIEDEELVVRSGISKEIALKVEDIFIAQAEMAKLDYLLARAKFGCEIKGIKPKIIKEIRTEKSKQIVNKADHPVLFSVCQSVNLPVKKELKEKNITYQPVDIAFTKNVNLITGANMAGKSTLLKTIGQLFYLTAHAIPLPCAEARLPLVDFISFGCDSETSQRTDLSSFASELISVNQALKREGYGLFLQDEFARGTNPKEGEAFARATVESFAEKDGLTISATHFTAPTLVEQAGHFRIRGLSNDNYEKLKMILNPGSQGEMSALTNRVQELHKYMDYSLEKVSEDKEPPKAALMIADILGIEPNILEKVKKYLEED